MPPTTPSCWQRMYTQGKTSKAPPFDVCSADSQQTCLLLPHPASSVVAHMKRKYTPHSVCSANPLSTQTQLLPSHHGNSVCVDFKRHATGKRQSNTHVHVAPNCSFLSAQKATPSVCLANKTPAGETKDSSELHNDPSATERQ